MCRPSSTRSGVRCREDIGYQRVLDCFKLVGDVGRNHDCLVCGDDTLDSADKEKNRSELDQTDLLIGVYMQRGNGSF